MSSSDDARDEARTVLNRAGTDIGDALRSGITGVIRGFFLSVIGFILVVRDFFLEPLQAVITGVTGLNLSIFEGAQDIIRQGSRTAVLSIAPGADWAIGPLTFLLSILAAAAGLAGVAWVLAQTETGSVILGLFVDPPILGNLIGESPEEEEGGDGD